MTTPRPFPIRFVSASTLLLTTMFLLGCQQSREEVKTMPAAAEAAAAPAEKAFLIFEGPWAVAPDPKDPGKILMIAPKTKSHKDLYASASNGATLAAGVYDLSIPMSGTSGATPATVGEFAQAKTTAADLQSVLDSKSGRYVIRVPKPEAYVAASHFRSRVGPSYPPDASTEKDYVSSVSLRYSVSSMNGFSLSGTPDNGSFKPFLLNVETPNVTFVIDPLHEIDPSEKCHAHSREAFRDLTRLVKVKLFVDYPDSPPSCHDTDPQKSKSAEYLQPPKSEKLFAGLRAHEIEVYTASLVPEIPLGNFMFATRPAFCTGVIIMLGTS